MILSEAVAAFDFLTFIEHTTSVNTIMIDMLMITRERDEETVPATKATDNEVLLELDSMFLLSEC